MPGVTRRPNAGSAYPHSSQDHFSWMKKDLPGGRKLWCQLVFGFFGVALLGALFVTLGGVFLKRTHGMAMKDSMSLPMVLCIVGIVSGSLMMIGSIVLGKLIISDKWRKNQQPVYNRNTSRAVFRNRGPDGEVQLQLPPPYEEEAPVYSIPPPQSEPNPPPAYSAGQGRTVSFVPVDIALELPSYEDATSPVTPVDTT